MYHVGSSVALTGFLNQMAAVMFRFAFPSLISFTLLTSVCGSVLAQSGDSQAVEKPKRQPPPVMDSVNEAMQRYVAKGRAAGAVTLVAHRGKVVHFGAVGLRDIESDKKMQRWTRFAIASMTKPITATAVMILHEQGKLDVNDPLEKYLPEFGNVRLKSGDEVSRKLTIRDALTHTSGIVGDQVFRGSLADHVTEVASRPLGFQPGDKWQYSPGVSVAGRVVEVVSGQPFEDFLRERIFQPLGMSKTTFRPDAKGVANLAVIYKPGENEGTLSVAGNRISTFTEEDGPNPSGGLVSTAQDLFRFYQMVLNGGEFRGQRVLSSQSVQMMVSPQIGDLETGFTPGNTWGLGWCIVKEPQGVTKMLSTGTYGHGGAFGTQGWVDPVEETIFILLIQRTNMGNSDGSEMRGEFQAVAVEALAKTDSLPQ